MNSITTTINETMKRVMRDPKRNHDKYSLIQNLYDDFCNSIDECYNAVECCGVKICVSEIIEESRPRIFLDLFENYVVDTIQERREQRKEERKNRKKGYK